MLDADDYLKKSQDPLWYGGQDANGVDLSLIRANLKLSPRERLLRGDRARRSALRLLEYGQRQREILPSDALSLVSDNPPSSAR